MAEQVTRFEEDESVIKARVVASIPDEWRAEPGDFTHDTVIPIVPEVKQLEINQDFILNSAFAGTAEGTYLDQKVAEQGLTRNVATPASGSLTINAAAGVVIPAGQILTTVILDNDQEPIEITADAEITFAVPGDLELAVTTTKTGAIMNVPAGSEWVMYPSIAGVNSITQSAALQFGQDVESDESLFSRWQTKIAEPILGGNKAAYKAWAIERPGVGDAKVQAIWAGAGTVKVILVDTAKRPVSGGVVTDVQNYIDQYQDAKGESQAPIGAIATIESAVSLDIDIDGTVTLAGGSVIGDVIADVEARGQVYLDSIPYDDMTRDVLYTQITTIIGTSIHVIDYTGVTVNGGTANISLDFNQIALIGAVTLHV